VLARQNQAVYDAPFFVTHGFKAYAKNILIRPLYQRRRYRKHRCGKVLSNHRKLS
jgi:hypothetical protein